MPSIVAKYQRCGKPNCHCSSGGSFHGPYYWVVTYVKARQQGRKGRYKWKYIGKSPEELEVFLKDNLSTNQYDLREILERTQQPCSDELKDSTPLPKSKSIRYSLP